MFECFQIAYDDVFFSQNGFGSVAWNTTDVWTLVTAVLNNFLLMMCACQALYFTCMQQDQHNICKFGHQPLEHHADVGAFSESYSACSTLQE